MSSQHKQALPAITVAAIGVVFGDIGTSPLYALKEIFNGHHPIPVTPGNILGVLSLVFWAIVVLVTIKYVLIIMRADNRGEGGSLALLALVTEKARNPRLAWVVTLLGIFAAALFFGDSMITPAISVLSAVEGLEIVTPDLKPYVIPLTLGILTGLFFIQKHGTGAVGKFFGPVMVAWFGILALLGVLQIASNPAVLLALNPLFAIVFIAEHPGLAFLALGSVVLAVTGGEALYTDMGHFGRFPIRLAWFGFVMPALVLNYFGQGALLLVDPQAIASPFYHLAPDWALIPMVGLATAATVIASQAVISGAFSVARQSIQMGLLPRMQIIHTSGMEEGQIYVPFTNWLLYLAVVALVIGFQNSSNLAAAYGIAVTGTMLIDTILVAFVMALLWNWNKLLVVLVAGSLLMVDIAFFAANAIKIPQGGWFPLAMAVVSAGPAPQPQAQPGAARTCRPRHRADHADTARQRHGPHLPVRHEKGLQAPDHPLRLHGKPGRPRRSRAMRPFRRNFRDDGNHLLPVARNHRPVHGARHAADPRPALRHHVEERDERQRLLPHPDQPRRRTGHPTGHLSRACISKY
jgi:KUP system potassium uptake protein